MRTWACRLVCLRRGPLHPPPLGIRPCQKRFLSLHPLCIRGVPVLVPVRLNPVALLKALPRVLAPRGRVIGIPPPPRLVIGGSAVGTINCVHFKLRMNAFLLFKKRKCVCLYKTAGVIIHLPFWCACSSLPLLGFDFFCESVWDTLLGV